MSCEHEVRFTIKPTDDACRFHFDVRAYKDRIVAPDEYSGATEVTPSDAEQVLATKDKTVRANITVSPAPVESLATSENGTFVPSSGNVGFSEVVVDVEPSLESLSVTENGLYLPESGVDGFDRVSVDVPVPSGSMEITDNGTYNVANKESVNVAVEGQWIDYDDVPVTLPEEYQRVEYIESSGTQYIELPIGFYPTDEIHTKGALPVSEGNYAALISSSSWNNNNNRFSIIALGNGKRIGVAYGTASAGDSNLCYFKNNDGELHQYTYKDTIFICIDLKICIGFGGVAFNAETKNIRLFYNRGSNIAGKICYYIHEKADGRKLALYACYRKSDGVIGMYDVENDVFYTNDGTGEFTKGQDI